jgi:leucyl/phenylalanyl-tRNA---protein transferase
MYELSPDILISGYSNGYFPMAESETNEIYWYSPDERAIFPIYEIKFAKSLITKIRKNEFEFAIDQNFEKTIRACASTHDDTWISEEIISAYVRLFEIGCAHSVETYLNGNLVGGLYGVALGGAFFGESMFNIVTDASKVAFYYLIQNLRARGYELLDSQFLNDFTEQLGAVEIPKSVYLYLLENALKKNCIFI